MSACGLFRESGAHLCKFMSERAIAQPVGARVLLGRTLALWGCWNTIAPLVFRINGRGTCCTTRYACMFGPAVKAAFHLTTPVS